MRKTILAPILWMQIQLTDLVYPNRVHNIAPQVCRSREGVRGTPWAPRNGLQVSEFADEYLEEMCKVVEKSKSVTVFMYIFIVFL